MRKFIAGILIVIMCAQMCVFASDLPFFDKDYTSYEETVTYSATLNKDIKIDLDGENSVFKGIENFVDIDALIKSVFDRFKLLAVKAAHFGKKAVKNRPNLALHDLIVYAFSLVRRRQHNIFAVADDAVFLYQLKLKQVPRRFCNVARNYAEVARDIGHDAAVIFKFTDIFKHLPLMLIQVRLVIAPAAAQYTPI